MDIEWRVEVGSHVGIKKESQSVRSGDGVEISVRDQLQQRSTTNNTENILINIDKQKIAQVVRNLLSNALKFTPRGGRITVKATVLFIAPTSNRPAVPAIPTDDSPLSPPYLRFEVTDSGPGVSVVRLQSAPK